MMPPIEIDPNDARDAAARELSDPAYRAAEPSIVDRFFSWLGNRFVDVLAALGGGSDALGLLVLVALGIGVYAFVRYRVGRLGRTAHAGRPVFAANQKRTADDYRRAAEDARASGDLAGAVRERFRALVRQLEERGVLDERTGRTADECAAQAGQRLPDRAAELRAAATVFDDVVYGDRDATEAAYHDLSTLDDTLRAVAAR